MSGTSIPPVLRTSCAKRPETRTQHIVNISGGKDSAACYTMACRMGDRLGKWRPVMADTGHEHEATMEYVARLHEQIGGPPVEIIKADFSADMERKRAFIREKWPSHGVPQAHVDRAIELLVPTGNPFLDLCMLKGRFPSRMAQFCTGELKRLPMQFQVVFPAAKRGPVLQWIGVRRDESANRRNTPLYRQDDGVRCWAWHPIRHWTADDVFAYLKANGVEPNPLYRANMRRVGCMPCINCSKSELATISRRFPEHIERVAEWERIVAAVSKRMSATMFAALTDPMDRLRGGYADIHTVVEWAKTDRGGRQYGLEGWLVNNSPAPTCQSVYGLCE